MMEGWKEVKIKDVCKIIGGYAFKSKDFAEDGQVPIIKIKSLKNRNLVIENGDFIDQSFLKLDEKFHIKFNDILIALTGSHITLPSSAVGRVAKSRHHQTLLLNQRVGKFVVDSNVCDHDFLYYTLITDYFFQSVGLRSKGAANQANISGGDVGNIKINLPPLPTQRKIAAILSAYDDLIENNLKRIQLLEEKAQLTYEEWFVRMKFPGHETTPVDEETGLPEGWEKKKLGDIIVNHDSKRIPISRMKREKIQGKYPYYGAASIMDYVNDYIFEGRYVLMGEDGTVITNEGYPKLQFVQGKIWVNNHAHVLEGKVISNEFLYLFLNQYPIKGHVTGVAQPKINQKNMNRILVKIASEKIQNSFDIAIKPLFDSIFYLNDQNQLLKEARDLLLPRLMTGVIDVEGMDVKLKEVN